MKYTVEISPFKKVISVEENALLSEVIQKAGINLRADCGNLGVCGKCRVNISSGHLPPVKEQEESFF